MKIKLSNILILTIIFLLFGAATTNPKKEHYISWCKEKMASEASSGLEKGLIAFLAGPIVENTTQTSNYIFFSIYDTSIDSEKMRVLGLFNNFIPISNTDKENINAKEQGA
jgi:hypothetical protein